MYIPNINLATDRMSKGIIAFEILVTDLQATKKLSQNRTDTEKKKIIETLSKSADTNEQLLAEYMMSNEHSDK
jgi:transcriptional regulator